MELELLAVTQGHPIRYPQIAGTDNILCPWWVEGVGAGVDFSLQIRVFRVPIRTDFTYCYLYVRGLIHYLF